MPATRPLGLVLTDVNASRTEPNEDAAASAFGADAAG